VKIDYNAPVVLTFAVVVIIIQLVNVLFFPALVPTVFAVRPTFSFRNPLDYVRLVSHVMGHASFDHLSSNLLFILLLGPVLEEKYGSSTIVWIILVTALSTGLINVLFFPTNLMGASGIVFAFIILVSIVNVRRGMIPLSFILVFILFIGGEIIRGLGQDQISQMAHIVGGMVGAVFGFRANASDI
jgi:membrane associated rhomboid family serine protease